MAVNEGSLYGSATNSAQHTCWKTGSKTQHGRGAPSWGGGPLVHDSKSRERSTRALRSRMTTAVVLLAGGAVVEGQVIGGFSLSL